MSPLMFALLIGTILLIGVVYIIVDRRRQHSAQQDNTQQALRADLENHRLQTLSVMQDQMNKNLLNIQEHLNRSLKTSHESLNQHIHRLTEQTDQRLQTLSSKVDQTLQSNMEKSATTIQNVIQRLTVIDEAQKKMIELSQSVVGLQDILSDKKARGAFGEVQLSHLIRNMLPEKHVRMQHTLSNGKRADCVLFLPEPTGHIVIDAKFPLESYRTLMDNTLGAADKRAAQQQFRQDIQKHITDIADKYIIPPETTDAAMMFIPAEAVFAEIHAHHSTLVDLAHKKRVWLVSPTTMMAVLTTSKAVLKDASTREQMHVIQQHLIALGDDFQRFQKRMDNLSRHMNQASQDVEQVHKSSQKITKRFEKIEKVELPEPAPHTPLPHGVTPDDRPVGELPVDNG